MVQGPFGSGTQIDRRQKVTGRLNGIEAFWAASGDLIEHLWELPVFAIQVAGEAVQKVFEMLACDPIFVMELPYPIGERYLRQYSFGLDFIGSSLSACRNLKGSVASLNRTRPTKISPSGLKGRNRVWLEGLFNHC